ncbi:complex I NDUFA9 subunit family protein [Amylibacter sp. IMCC11727]|uniref:complex I NDUFA9 subunit family protein n=1 Tax=Amylibacter sp. IMCC11727 TaxID=3039851 RepID=UPI00244DC067|nr:complex I NDUFA9 subunit family protein [Amylibacter sp. IMCC11727]WGI22148.1 complex I NDUFA9 subunit family protein [Amylibacter sp. IMCC11727]
MSQSPKLVTIFGGSGFVGRYIARRMTKEGWRVRVAVRRPNEAVFVRPYGVVGQVEPILANIRNEESVRSAIQGADAVVNCVSVLQETGKQTFEALNDAGAGCVAKIAAEEGVGQLVHISALGADLSSDSDSARTKAEGEQAVLAAFPSAMILRPSVIFGTEDQFFNRFAEMTKLGPVLPLVGGNSRFQPVYVDDVAQAACQGILGQAAGGIYELGGPEADTLANLMHRMLHAIRRRRLVINLPFFVGTLMGKALGLAQFLSFGIFTNTILTADQVKQLRKDNVVSEGAKTFADLGISPTGMDAVVDQYLYQYRPYGQYAELTESAKNLKGAPTTSDF